jgi:3-hydroxyisobutyrate dehydrogenase
MAGARRIGFVGLGAMGSGMAARLVGAGLAVRGHDVSAGAVDAFVRAGGAPGRSPAEVAHDAELLALVVATAEQVDAVLFGPQGAATVLPAGATVALHSTVAPGYAVALGQRLATSGHLLLDAPISGGVARAAAGTLTVMASGPPAAFDAAGPALQAMAERVYRLGEAPGAGSTVKMVNQLLAGVHIAVAAEAIALGTRAGADPRALFEVISNSAGNSWMFQNRVPHMLEGDQKPLSAVEIFVKDLGIVLEAGKALRFPLPLAAAAHQQFLAAAAAGFGRADDSAVVKVYERLAGIDVAAAAKAAGQPPG